MAIGHLIQNILKLEEALATVNLALYQLWAEVNSLGAEAGRLSSPGDEG